MEPAMLDRIGTVTLVAAIVFDVGALAAAAPDRWAPRLLLLAVAGLWAGLAVMLAGSGALLSTALGPVPPVGVMVAVPPVAAGIAAALSPGLRMALAALPTELLIGLNAIRILGLFFLLLAAQGRLGGPFPYSAGWGDVVTGALALPVIAVMRRRGRAGLILAQAWNWFGALDLFAAVSLGAMSAEGTPLQVFHTGIAGPLPVQLLPWSLIPTVLVPLYLILHGIIFVQLRRRASAG
jgi:hypothetical protein